MNFLEIRPALVRQARAIVREGAWAEEIADETLYRAQKASGKLVGKSVAAWLSMVARNLSYDYLREQVKERRRRGKVSGIRSRTPLELLIERETHDLLKDALEDLTPMQRAVVDRLEVQERSVKEIALELGLSLESVRSAAFRARRTLARRLKKLIA